MKYLLLVSLIVNVLLICKILAMRVSVKELRTEFVNRGAMDSNTLIGISSRDKELRGLVSAINNTLKELQASYHRYQRGDAELKNAITNIAHDLRTPLTAICGYVELYDRTEDQQTRDKYLSVIGERAAHMRKLTEELFEYSVITGGEIKEEKKELLLNRILEDTVMSYYPALSERGIEPVIEITDTPLKRRLITSYVERIFSNLISNALKYSDGDLTIRLTDSGTLTVSNTASKLSVVDVEKLFDRFFTVETARNEQAHGLGLSIVKLFCERMGCPQKATYENRKLVIEISF